MIFIYLLSSFPLCAPRPHIKHLAGLFEIIAGVLR